MRKLLIGLLIAFPILCHAELSSTEQQSVDLYCFNTDELFKTLKEVYGENPVLLGESSDNVNSTMSFWIGQNGGTFTIVVTKKELSCIVNLGKNIKILKNGKLIS